MVIIACATTVIVGGVAPTVSLNTANVAWTSGIGSTYANLRYDTSGEEFNNSSRADNYLTSRGNWLDTGDSSDVWLVRTINSGSLNNLDPGAGRLNMGTTRSLSVVDTNPASGGNVANLDLEMWDAASGGNSLDSVAGLTLTATYFDTCPLCCFTPETLVTMGDGTKKAIGKIKVGELIANQGGAERVGEVIVREQRPMIKLTFEDSRTLVLSIDHPIYVKGKGAACVQPETAYKDIGIALQLEIGDYVKTDGGLLIKLVGIESFHYPEKVYTFSNSLFFAGGILVY